MTDLEIASDRIVDMWTGGLSMMPESLESGLDLQAFADLLEYLQE